MYYILLLICLLSRIISSIYYIEDIDSLRFALSIVDEYSVAKYQPHFPGYPVYCFIAIILYKITGSLAISASLIGGLSTFFIIYFSLKILKIKIESKSSVFLILITFFNPMIWILGNRYMPDLMGMSVALASIHLILSGKKQNEQIIGYLLAGILLGIRLSYFPLLILPIIIIFFNNKKYYVPIISIISGLLIWIIPFVFTEGLNDLITVALQHVSGHFNDYGGTIITEKNIFIRLKFLVNTIWSDGLGGYWKNRNLITIIISLLTISIFIKSKSYKVRIDKNFKIFLFSCLLYLIWIFFFQNLIYKSRHVLPLIVASILIIAQYQNSQKSKLLSLTLPIFLFLLTFNLITSHKFGTSIYLLKNHIQQNEKEYILSNSLINYYLKNNGIESNFINVDKIDKEYLFNSIDGSDNIIMIGDYSKIFETHYNIDLDTTFYHNPYMNRMWSEIPLYSLSLK
ncbi:MAG: hypothetical protein CMF96_06670 [Candidatus Marinimicrobia bacterium]|nr:hypothetical protein [Candidatus Neomarinimicrobiota bacterium]